MHGYTVVCHVEVGLRVECVAYHAAKATDSAPKLRPWLEGELQSGFIGLFAEGGAGQKIHN